MDLMVPQMDAISLCRAVRDELQISAETMPVIILNGEDWSPEIFATMQSMSQAAGANAFMNARDKASMFEAQIRRAKSDLLAAQRNTDELLEGWASEMPRDSECWPPVAARI
jgi:CheY-like chemotaxis protein